MRKVVLKEKDISLGNLILVNSYYKLKREPKQSSLQEFKNNVFLDNECCYNLKEILKKIPNQEEIIPVSGFRTKKEQINLYTISLKENGEDFTKRYIAFPNTSEHQTGLAIDLGLKGENDLIRPRFPNNKLGKQFRHLASSYGFIERYKENKVNITKIAAEMWHFRYVSFPHSKIITEKDFCLEEYHDYLKQFPYPDKPLKYQNYEIYYLKYQKNKKIMLQDKDELSGNNIDGFILTRMII